MKPKSIAIIGLGLMGGSLAAACRIRFPKTRILGVSRNAKALAFAKRKGWIHESCPDFPAAAACDLAVLCTPVNTFKEVLACLESHASRPLLVTDVGSVKGEISRFAASRRWKNVQYVGAHPMVGSHKQGVAAAIPGLYDNGLIFVTPGKKSNPSAVRKITEFWRAVSPRIVKTTPAQHDEIVSEVSHLPHALAVCLMLAVNKKNLDYAASGFRDVTRIAASDPSIWIPIFLSNRTTLLKHLRRYEKVIQAFRQELSAGDETALRKALTKASGLRLEI